MKRFHTPFFIPFFGDINRRYPSYPESPIRVLEYSMVHQSFYGLLWKEGLLMETAMFIFTAISCVSGVVCAISGVIALINTYRNQK